ncbi:IS110 family transposase [Oribacterium sp. C9]|uniref:IS110 family transposase n=1 Tax=Oribacterium sp. C9 TaxID=1943579 RepID=UPI00098EF90F|nr:IS110 family transposase [Oribacterium sp. C9]OON84661.1 IS110 family transposase [Oribacterium sp. C9]
MNAVGIDVSKGKSMVAVMKPFGEIVYSPFEVQHNEAALKDLAKKLLALKGETRVVIEYTGNYYTPIANILSESGIYVSVINAILIHDYKNNSLRRVKTDKKDAVKLANYAIDSWLELPRYHIEDDARMLLKNYYHQYEQYSKLHTMISNNLISLLDITYPGVNKLFKSTPREDGHEKWVDFVHEFYHSSKVISYTRSVFHKRYNSWCKKYRYRYSESKADEIYNHAKQCVSTLPNNEHSKKLIQTCVTELQLMNNTLFTIRTEMHNIAASLPEYPVVMSMYGVGTVLGPQLIAEIGNVRRFHSKKALIAYAGIDAPPYQSGDVNVKSRSMTKRGSSSLRHTLFLIMGIYLKNSPQNEPIYQYMIRKKAEGKHFKVYIMASANKFLRCYYAIVNNYLKSID